MDTVHDLTGRLLVATPQIGDGIFFRSVILVLHHDDDGAQGVILNRPLDAHVDAILPGWESLATGPPTVFHGGPVQIDSALGVVAIPGIPTAIEAVRPLFRGVGLVDLDADPGVVGARIGGLRIYAGYAGWTSGQLEGEIGIGSWYVVDAEAGDVFVADPTGLWRAVLRRQPAPLSFVATMPDDPTAN